ncbi:glycine cleavage system aminomethyltransferase GcvT [Pseudalkalibacillus hwajinpoensis]|uniref:glycine cleavage system aminomethyltransferase GcvT n=1 Tax=Guptibacillus hwajinpoensis TaxID=208199 RepID=UPI001CD680B9|nr:glycine cleavage system aminomethyltransferase GcvT [Pseudalkalibacillus hwajinpoensis]MCA0991018.1 glycine cleavage system aminomethyltransferase GcvT [Pseudalkalibacillus hwajinpoensis]
MSELLKTPLFETYKSMGAKTIDFGGWALPVQFSSIKEEHEAVRTRAGLFDVSHMGEIDVKGEKALDYLQKMMTNDVSKLKVDGAQYTAMCYEDGGTVDDLLVYKYSEEHYLLVVNAANTVKDFDWLKEHIIEGVSLNNISNEMAQLAIQGPKAEVILQRLTNTDLSSIGFFKFQADLMIAGIKTLVSRTGYTGEDGFELYTASEDAPALWKAILAAGEPENILPCGLGARDTLRFEAKLALYGQELTKDISPLEAGIGFAVKTSKEADFIGKSALLRQRENSLDRKLVGIEMIGRGIPRTNYPVYKGEQLIGEVTTGTQSPTLKKNVGLALIKKEYTEMDTELDVEIRNKRVPAKVIPSPFYKRQK